MGNEEVAKVRVEIDGKDAQSVFEGLTQEGKEINAQLREMKKAGEEGSEAWQELKTRQKEINAELKEFKHNIDVSEATINELNSALGYWQTQARKAKEGSDEWVEATTKIQEIKPRIKELTDEMYGLGEVVEKQAEPSGGMWANLKTSILGVFTGTALWDLAKEAGAAIFSFGMDVFETTAKFEKYEAVLGNALGTQEKAAQAMGDIKKMAAETPFSVDELTESYVKYVNRGIIPTMEEMTKLGDIAASQGKSFDQLTEAVLDATTGEFERLKEFGIQASKAGDEVSFAFKGVQQTVANTPDAIKGALLAFGELEGVAGGMAVVSETLEGRVSNLGDNFDALKLLIGDGLKPVFSGILDIMSGGIEILKGLFSESQPIVSVFESVWDIVENLIGTFKSLLENIGLVSDDSITLRQVINGVAVAFQAALTPVQVFLAVLQGGYDGLNAIINKGKEVANFFGADFKIDTTATFDKMQENFMANMTSIQNGWTKTVSEININTMKDGLDKAIEMEDKKYEAAKARINKEVSGDKEKLAAIVKLNKDHEDAVTSLKNTSLNNQATVKIQTINKTAKTEEDRSKQTQQVVDKLFNEMNTKAIAGSKKTQETITETEKKEGEKRGKAAKKLADDKKKDEEKSLKSIEDMQVKAIADDTKRKLAQAKLDYDRKAADIKKSLASDATKNKELEALQKLHKANIEKINADALKKQEKAEADKRKKDQAELKKKQSDERKYRDDKLKSEKKLLDDEFKAEVAKAKIELSLAKENSAAMWAAKKNTLEIEARYKADKLRIEATAEKARIAESLADQKAKLEQDAANEKARIAESISDFFERANKIRAVDLQTQIAIVNNSLQASQQVKAIDERLTAELTLSETQLQNDKKKLQEQANEAKRKNNEEFFKALDQAMKGDVMAFIKHLKDKAVADGKHLNERTEAFSKYGQQIGTLMQTAIDGLIKLNADYTKKQIDNLTKEKEANFKKLDDEYAKGKITKEELDAEKIKLQDKFDKESMELKKKEFERNKKLQIANSIIAGAMAVLSALAMPWPVGLAMAVVAGVKTAVDIAKIKNQKFEGRSGGVFKNAGVAQGGRHGSRYGEAGIAMYDRATGDEVGEIEGGEPVMVLSRNTYKNNKPVIDRLLHSSLHKNGAPISMRNGGTLMVSEAGYVAGRMYDRGGMVGEQTMDGMDAGGYQDNSSTYNTAQTDAMIQKNAKITEDTEKNTRETAETLAKVLGVLIIHSGILRDIKNKPDGTNEILNAIDRLRQNALKANAK